MREKANFERGIARSLAGSASALGGLAQRAHARFVVGMPART